MKKETVKKGKMHQFLVCASKSQDFAQSQENYASSHGRETVTFRNSGPVLVITTKTYIKYDNKLLRNAAKTSKNN